MLTRNLNALSRMLWYAIYNIYYLWSYSRRVSVMFTIYISDRSYYSMFNFRTNRVRVWNFKMIGSLTDSVVGRYLLKCITIHVCVSCELTQSRYSFKDIFIPLFKKRLQVSFDEFEILYLTNIYIYILFVNIHSLRTNIKIWEKNL